MRPVLLILAALSLAGCTNARVVRAPLVAPTDPLRAQPFGPSSGADMPAPADEDE